jgi:hypothetical protein
VSTSFDVYSVFTEFLFADDFYEQFLLAHNELRENHGSPPLQWSEELAELAQQWADKLAHKNFLTYCELPGPLDCFLD